MALSEEELKALATNPKKAKNENGEMEMHSLDDLIDMDRHLASKGKGGSNALKCVGGGTVVNSRGTR